MKTIMYNDRYDLTYAVIKRDKKQTRRIEKSLSGIENAYDDLGFTRFEYKTDGKCWLWNDKTNTFLEYVPRYKIGEVVAVAQSYKDLHREFSNPEDEHTSLIQDYCLLKLGDHYEKSAGWNNKMFVASELMPHQIRITGVRIERLQDISEEDCLKEGVRKTMSNQLHRFCLPYDWCGNKYGLYGTKQRAYAALIDRVSGKGTWESNPFVWVYDFELIK